MRAARLLRALAVLTLAAGGVSRAQQGSVRVCAGGDVTLGVNGDTITRKGRKVKPRAWPDPAALLAPVVPLFADADIVLLNLEGAIGDGPATKCAAASRSCYGLRMPAAAAPALRGINDQAVVVGNLANNHAHDGGDDGFDETRRRLDSAGVLVTGADSDATVVVTALGDTVVVLGFAASYPMDVRDLALVRRYVARAALIAPRVVVTMHLGAEGPTAQRTGNKSEKFVGEDRGDPVAFARAAVESGATLVIGHGPHVVRGVSWMNGALVFYSLGNLITAGPFAMHSPNDRGLVACADLGADGTVTRAVLRPTRQRGAGSARPDLSARAIVLADSLGSLDFPDSSARMSVEAELRRPPGPPR